MSFVGHKTSPRGTRGPSLPPINYGNRISSGQFKWQSVRNPLEFGNRVAPFMEWSIQCSSNYDSSLGNNETSSKDRSIRSPTPQPLGAIIIRAEEHAHWAKEGNQVAHALPPQRDVSLCFCRRSVESSMQNLELRYTCHFVSMLDCMLLLD
jgi:hypothetical protein